MCLVYLLSKVNKEYKKNKIDLHLYPFLLIFSKESRKSIAVPITISKKAVTTTYLKKKKK